MSQTPQARAEARLQQLTREWEDAALQETPEQRSAEIIARMVLSPANGAAFITDRYRGIGQRGDNKGLTPLSLITLVELMAARVGTGDLADLEDLLVAQAVSLNALYVNLTIQASEAKADRQRDLLVLAMKVQSNCRATIAAIGDLKFPKAAATFVRQANISAGPQQVNNTLGVPAAPVALSHQPGQALGAELPVEGRHEPVPVLARARARGKRKSREQSNRGRE